MSDKSIKLIHEENKEFVFNKKGEIAVTITVKYNLILFKKRVTFNPFMELIMILISLFFLVGGVTLFLSEIFSKELGSLINTSTFDFTTSTSVLPSLFISILIIGSGFCITSLGYIIISSLIKIYYIRNLDFDNLIRKISREALVTKGVVLANYIDEENRLTIKYKFKNEKTGDIKTDKYFLSHVHGYSHVPNLGDTVYVLYYHFNMSLLL